VEDNFSLKDSNGVSRDFFFEMQKHSMHLRKEFTSRQLAVYELFKKTIELPGSIAELGVRNGANYFFLARLLEIFCPAQRFDGISSKHLFGFDTFSGFPSVSEEDRSSYSWPDMKDGGVTTNRSAFFKDFESFKQESSISGRLHIVEGDVCETLPVFLEERPGLRFSLIYLDMDIFKPTALALELLWDKIVPGGIVVFDEYALMEFPGESAAADEFFKGADVEFKCIPWCYCPSAYVVKG
jgi:hypothetical protein